ncbi:hypothetical protein JRQ81_019568 [Phrynocephalus forsythii]|uniref:NADPH oxidase 4 n=1 Tax=Phrynocephalus forsythii TaxID=171643 RepID=A0A9Q0XP63_9SAUR|nr:hypothetical protein JRQ81_019568 [Phrynocephalus forsythii]
MAPSCRGWLANEGCKHLLLLLWLSLNVGLFGRTFRLFYCEPQYYYLHQMLGLGLCLSRASASVLNLNCSLVLLPVCRILLAFLRGSRKDEIFEELSGELGSPFHFSGSCCCTPGECFEFSANYSEQFVALNAARYHGEDPRKLLFATGKSAKLPPNGVESVKFPDCLFSASELAIVTTVFGEMPHVLCLRKNIIFFLFKMSFYLHRGVLKYQTNLKEHPPGCFNPNATVQESRRFAVGLEKSLPENAFDPFPGESVEMEPLLKKRIVCAEEPQFQAHFPETWLWISGPLCLYCAERLYRYICNSNKPVLIIAVISHPCDVLEIRMTKEGFRARPGQYIVLHCPSVSSVESHPFTLTLCPTATKATFGVHVKVVGDWTERLRDMLFLPSSWDAEILPVFQQRRYPKLYVDGPFGSPFEETFNYEVSLCVAGGIGVTPFASILNTLLDGWEGYKLRRLYFIWVCRDVQAFCWFADLLCRLHDKLWHDNRPDFINIQLYLSRTHEIQKIMGDKYRVLNRRLFVGRPRWKLLFNEISKCNRQKTVGVFCCGPSGLSKALHKLSNSHNPYGTTFEYNKESFS